jgi:hypothetical protein
VSPPGVFRLSLPAIMCALFFIAIGTDTAGTATARTDHGPTAEQILLRSAHAAARFKTFRMVDNEITSCSCGGQVVIRRHAWQYDGGDPARSKESESLYFSKRMGQRFAYQMVSVGHTVATRYQGQWKCTIHWAYDKLWRWLPKWYTSDRGWFGYSPSPTSRVLPSTVFRGVPVRVIEMRFPHTRIREYISRRDYTLRRSVTLVTVHRPAYGRITSTEWQWYSDYGASKEFRLPSACTR